MNTAPSMTKFSYQVQLLNPIQYGGPLWPPPNFVVSSSITIKIGILIEFDKFPPK